MRTFVSRIKTLTFLDVSILLIILSLLGISGYATYEGIHDLILAQQPRLVREGYQRYYIMAAVGVLTLAMWVLLEVALRRGIFTKRFISAVFYVVLALWSIGFGYGFWWKTLASGAAAQTSSTDSAFKVELQVQSATGLVQGISEQLQVLKRTSDGRQRKEEVEGGSCDGIKSAPTKGPLFRAREAITGEIDTLYKAVSDTWLAPLTRLVVELRSEGSKLDGRILKELGDEEKRIKYREVEKTLRSKVSEIRDLHKRQGGYFAPQFNSIALKLEAPSDPKAVCQDRHLAGLLRLAAKRANEEPQISEPSFDVNLGDEATAHAFNKVWDNVFFAVETTAAKFGLATVRTAPQPMHGKDIIALVAAIVVDICIFVFTFIRTRRPLDASHMFQAADSGAREKLELAIKAFEQDDQIDARRVFNACIMRDGKTHYFILPSLAAPLAPGWRAGAAFLQNILIVLEEVRAVDRSYDHLGVWGWMRAKIPGLGMRRQFRKGAQQLTRFGWSVDEDEVLASDEEQEIDDSENTEHGGRPSLAGRNARARLNASDISLYRLRRSDLLELLLVVRDNPANARPSAAVLEEEEEAKPDPRIQKAGSDERPRVTYRELFARWLPRWKRRRPSRTAEAKRPAAPVSDPERQIYARDAAAEPDIEPRDAADISTGNGEHFSNTVGERRPRLAPQEKSELPRLETFPRQRRSANGSANDLDAGEVQNSEPLVQNEPNRPVTSLEQVFDAIDDLNHAAAFARSVPDRSGDAEGFEITTRRLVQHLDNAGLEPTAKVGQQASHALHSTISEQSSDLAAGKIVRVLKQGYRHKETGRMVRNAEVVVSSGSGARIAT